ncbi:MAG TPA: RagB/SusD family nutrient uptake outer membrane protein, partial [Niabella sp.]|nr:RagB/SusD family nutrient uptake outer membrane protein [Niabella sp.]
AGLNYGWYSNLARYNATIDYTRNENYKPWRYYYRIVFGANNVIDALGGTDVVPESDEQKHIMGQAKGMRAYAYFYLAQLFSKGYNESEKILPIYTNTEVPNQPKSTAKEVYDLIIDDLTEAISYLETFERATKDQVDKWVAKGLLAYVLSARGTNADLQQVVTLTNEITGEFSLTSKKATVLDIAAGETVATNSEAGFNNIATPSWIWGVDLTLANGLDLVSWWGQVDYYTYSYAWAGDPKTIDRGLFDAIRSDDIRKKQFHSTLRPLYKFFDPGRTAGGQRNIITDYVYMRADEFVLLNAEANARLGQTTDARNSLKKLLELRLTDYSYVDNLSGDALLNEVYLQTRIELWGEGKAYLAMKRLKKDVKRGSNHLFSANATIPYDDAKLTFSIPQAEVLNNPNLNK